MNTKHTLFLIISLLLPSSLLYGASKEPEKEALHVIQRFLSGTEASVKLKQKDKFNTTNWFESRVENGVLEISGGSGVALCRGFYDYIKSEKIGINSWSGNRVAWSSPLKDKPSKLVQSQYKHHYYFNVVTYGYSLPYWDWERWEQEIDWMALHGIDMPLALVANEAISRRVWLKMGLTEEEIAHYFVGPAHLPWMRMGNISELDGPLPVEWHDDQIALQHKILSRMKALGMKPICPGFAGFVPKELQRVYPDVELVETHWGGAFNNWMLSPEDDLFHEMGKLFIQEWEKEFGENDFYIVDSFNEMEIPFPPKGKPARYELLASYGDKVYQSIKAGNKNATWVMQGWMFGYQRHIWDYETLEALVSKVPDNKMLLLDLAVDYNTCFWQSEVNWEFYKGFYNKPWVYSVIPNMGGKTGMTGILSFYANGHLEALQSNNRGNLVGYGMAPEGIENNEVVYELICDAGWSESEIDLKQWLEEYSICRFGEFTPEFNSFWNNMLTSVYGTFTDHPRYNWQFRPSIVRKGSIHASQDFYRGIESLAHMAPNMKDNKLFVIDFTDWVASYLGGKIELLIQDIEEAYLYDEQDKALEMESLFIELMKGMDGLLAYHPNKDLQHWIDFARKKSQNPSLQKYYESNARRIVTIWGPPVDDYSARIWSGLIRDYYLPRWEHYFTQKKSGQSFDFVNWESNWVEKSSGLSFVEKLQDPVEEALRLMKLADDIAIQGRYSQEIVGSWSKEDIKVGLTTLKWNLPAGKMNALKSIKIVQLNGEKSIGIKGVEIEMDGSIVYSSEESVDSKTNPVFNVKMPSQATGNNSCVLTIKVESDGKSDSVGRVELIL